VLFICVLCFFVCVSLYIYLVFLHLC
jgi:hypothetical protein